MQAPETPEDELERLAALQDQNLLGTPAEADFDRLTRLARRHFGVATVLFSVVDEDRQWFKSRQGLDVAETGRDISFCGHTILGEGPLVVENARTDPRFADNPLVTGGPQIGFYAGAPVFSRDRYPLGTLCLIDPEPRDFGAAERADLEDFARLVELALEARSLSATELRLIMDLDIARRDALICPMTQVWNRRGFAQMAERELAAAKRAGKGLGVAMVDIDRFKRVNDTWGHGVGDEVIVKLAEILRDVLRREDVLARMGGEEFAILLPQANLFDLAEIGEKLIGAIRARGAVRAMGGEGFTASIGLAMVEAGAAAYGVDRMLERADAALYAAKEAGRDRFMVAGL